MLDKEDRDCLVRIDERTKTLVDTMEKHLEQNREDFSTMHSRINKISARQQLILGIGTGVGTVLGLAIAWARGFFA